MLGDCPIIGDIAVLDSLLHNMYITKDIYSVGGQKAVQDPSNWNYE